MHGVPMTTDLKRREPDKDTRDILRTRFQAHLGSGWYDLEHWDSCIAARWMKDEAEVIVDSQRDGEAIISFRALSYHIPRRVAVIYNEQTIFEACIPVFKNKAYCAAFPIELKTGCNSIFLRADSFESPSAVSGSEDTRSLSIAIHNFRIYETHFDYMRHPRKLNLGCGFDYRLDYLNVDLLQEHDPDLAADIRTLPLPSDYYEEIMAQDCLEHLPRGDVKAALAEWVRLLSPGGELHIRVPDLVELSRRMLVADERQQEQLVHFIYGTQLDSCDYHQAGFTGEILKKYLMDAGFEKISCVTEDWLLDCVTKKA